LVFDPANPLDYVLLGLGPFGLPGKVIKGAKGFDEILQGVKARNKVQADKLSKLTPTQKSDIAGIEKTMDKLEERSAKLGNRIANLEDATSSVAKKQQANLIAEQQKISTQLNDFQAQIDAIIN
jgi:hypothetical protein